MSGLYFPKGNLSLCEIEQYEHPNQKVATKQNECNFCKCKAGLSDLDNLVEAMYLMSNRIEGFHQIITEIYAVVGRIDTTLFSESEPKSKRKVSRREQTKEDVKAKFAKRKLDVLRQP